MEVIIKQSYILTRLMKIFGYYSPVTIIIAITLITWTILYNKKRSRLVRLINKIPGPPSLPLLGNTVEINVDHDEIYARLTGMRYLWGRRQGLNKAWLGPTPYIFVSEASAIEPIMSSPKHIDKSPEYEYLQPWLGTGLLTSHGKKWHSRRKILTPAFHFKILEDFIDVFNEQSAVLVKRLATEVGNNSFNIFPYVTLCALDIVCETAMGRHINAQDNSDSEYVKAVYKIGAIVQNRQSKIWLQPNLIFRMTEQYKQHKKCLDILHGFSYRVIYERKEEIKKAKERQLIENNNESNDGNNNKIEDDVGSKKRLAFLDLLIEASNDGRTLNVDDIREEVDTFMFEGHDTTSAAISWTLFLLGERPEVQDKVAAELYQVFGDDQDRPATMNELLNLKYLDCVIKEALRLYPSVPIIARYLKEDVKIGDYIVPSGTTAMIMPYMLHRNPNVFKKPEQFNPDNFLPENSQGRHPYAYIPFSAGPRNCIGQKFAMLEEKCVISSVIRKYCIEAVDRREDLTLLGELILRPKDGLKVRITRRQPLHS